MTVGRMRMQFENVASVAQQQTGAPATTPATAPIAADETQDAAAPTPMETDDSASATPTSVRRAPIIVSAGNVQQQQLDGSGSAGTGASIAKSVIVRASPATAGGSSSSTSIATQVRGSLPKIL